MHLHSSFSVISLLSLWTVVTAAPEGIARAPQITITLTRRIAICPTTRTAVSPYSTGSLHNNSSSASIVAQIALGNGTLTPATSTSATSGSGSSLLGSSSTSLTGGGGSSSFTSSITTPSSSGTTISSASSTSTASSILRSASSPTTSRGITTITDPPFTASSGTSSTIRLSSSTTSKLSCVPSSTQVISNPSFELDLDGSGHFASPWTLTGNALIQVNTPPIQAALGLHIAILTGGGAIDILSGHGSTTATLSQNLSNLVPGVQYKLQYYYSVLRIFPLTVCTFTASITDGVVLDSIVNSGSNPGQYLVREVTYTPASAAARLDFSLGCPSSILGIEQIVVALDVITLTRSGGDGCP